MNEQIYYKKLYTVAFRLTGNEESAYELTTKTLSLSLNETETKDYFSAENFMTIVLVMFKLYIDQADLFCCDFDYVSKKIVDTDDFVNKLQIALFKLKPINRVIIIWKDILNFRLDEVLQIIPITKKELYAELNCSYKLINEYLNSSH